MENVRRTLENAIYVSGDGLNRQAAVGLADWLRSEGFGRQADTLLNAGGDLARVDALVAARDHVAALLRAQAPEPASPDSPDSPEPASPSAPACFAGVFYCDNEGMGEACRECPWGSAPEPSEPEPAPSAPDADVGESELAGKVLAGMVPAVEAAEARLADGDYSGALMACRAAYDHQEALVWDFRLEDLPLWLRRSAERLLERAYKADDAAASALYKADDNADICAVCGALCSDGECPRQGCPAHNEPEPMPPAPAPEPPASPELSEAERYNLNRQMPGCVLMTREENGYHDSDFYAIVWNAGEKACQKVYYHTTRYYSVGSARADATDEVRESATEWVRREVLKRLEAESVRQASCVAEGREVVVARGRKVPRGTRGIVRREVSRRYGRYPVKRVGIEVPDAAVKCSADIAWTEGRCSVRSPFDREFVRHAKALGAKWHPADKTWVADGADAACALRDLAESHYSQPELVWTALENCDVIEPSRYEWDADDMVRKAASYDWSYAHMLFGSDYLVVN